MCAEGGGGVDRVGLWKASVARLVLSEMPTIADEVAQADLATGRALSANGSESEWLRVGYQIVVRHDSEVRLRLQLSWQRLTSTNLAVSLWKY